MRLSDLPEYRIATLAANRARRNQRDPVEAAQLACHLYGDGQLGVSMEEAISMASGEYVRIDTPTNRE